MAYPDVTQPWYADYASALGTCDNIGLYFNPLRYFGSGCGYYPKPSEIFLIVHPGNIAEGKEFGLCLGFKVCAGAHYLVSFIGDDESKRQWLKYWTSKWEKKFV